MRVVSTNAARITTVIVVGRDAARVTTCVVVVVGRGVGGGLYPRWPGEVIVRVPRRDVAGVDGEGV